MLGEVKPFPLCGSCFSQSNSFCCLPGITSQMRTNEINLERAMRAFDFESDGFISIDDLKAVLDNFVLPTTDEVFQQLMHA